MERLRALEHPPPKRVAGVLRVQSDGGCVPCRRGAKSAAEASKWCTLENGLLTQRERGEENSAVVWSAYLTDEGAKLVFAKKRALLFRLSLVTVQYNAAFSESSTAATSSSSVTSGSVFELYAPSSSDFDEWEKAFRASIQWRVETYYSVKEEIGAGKFAKVYRGVNNATGRVVAIKSIDKKRGTEVVNARAREKLRLYLAREQALMLRVNHPNIVLTYDIFESANTLSFVLECMEGGTLFHVLQKEHSFFESSAAHVMRQVLLALDYLHRNSIVHRDIKPDNILCANGAHPLTIKVADFGLARDMDVSDPSRASARPAKMHSAESSPISKKGALLSVLGTPSFIPPEMIKKSEYGAEVDLWSAGVLMYLLLTGRLPIVASDMKEAAMKIRDGAIPYPQSDWEHISEAAKNLTRSLLTTDGSARLTASQALRHQWFSDTAQNKPSAQIDLLKNRDSVLRTKPSKDLMRLNFCGS